VGNGFGRSEASVVEIVAPAVGAGQALAGPPLELERRQILFAEVADQRPLLDRRDEVGAIFKAGDQRLAEQVGAHPPKISLSSDGRSSGLS